MIKKRLFLLDGNSIICRYFYGLPEKKSPDGINVNGVFGFTNFLSKFILKEILDSSIEVGIIVCLDKARNNFRKELSSTYKKNRPPLPENFFHQMRLCEEVCEYFNIPTDFHDRYEADDLIATYANKFSHESDTEIIILSNDKDLLQLVSKKKNTKVYNVSKKKSFNEDEVFNTIGVYPNQIAEFLAISGDQSDNISGVFKVGPKTTIKLLHKYGNLNNIINSEEGKKKDFTCAREFLKLTKLFDEAPVKNIAIIDYDLPNEKILDCLNRYGFTELMRYFY